MSFGKRLEQYTLKRPHEVLIVDAIINGDNDQVLVFKGFSSSLLQSTAYDPDVPILPDTSEILSIDRLASPYHPTSPRYLEQGLSLEEMEKLLAEVGV